MTESLSYGRQQVDDDDIKAVTEVLRGDWLTTGPAVGAFEAALEDLTGAAHVVAVANGTAALHLAALALDIGLGDLGLSPPLTFLASANCLAMAGADVRFADVDPATWCLSVEEVDRYCRTSGPPAVVVAVDFAGVPADLPALFDLSRKHGFRLIEDAAHAVGSTYQFEGKTVACGSGAHSDLAVFSFHPVKNITSAEGGAVLTNDPELAERIRRLATHGLVRDPRKLRRYEGPWSSEMVELGYNYRLSDVHCALGLSQLRRLDAFKARRAELVRRYNQAFADHADVLAPPPWPAGCDPCFHLYVLSLTGPLADRRLDLFMHLQDRQIMPQVHYRPVHTQPYYVDRHGADPEDCPVSLDVYARTLSLPLFPAMSDADADRVIAAVRSFVKAEKRRW
ncbi:MAG: UDP-4-amino-4,6-dideoxy-N-acetyl-beta-L-altrosamine transaminase [Proteobacteria bacterium]|nr:UDP-4-amino-4,6-dideoxy-N-acetyl-beta-L-altrosamine transaminase [Pseudomonadota bacterium]